MQAQINKQEVLHGQCEHWKKVWGVEQKFPTDSSYAAQVATGLFRKKGVQQVLELGSGNGRDSMCFLKSGFDLKALDYAEPAIRQLTEKAKAEGVGEKLETVCHDIRNPLPFSDNSMDACFSHMLYCMALTDEELFFLNQEVLRVLKPGGVNVYTARNIHDPAFGTGIHRGGLFYELIGGFIIRFFDDDTVAQLTEGYDLLSVEMFDDGDLPKRLTMVTMQKQH